MPGPILLQLFSKLISSLISPNLHFKLKRCVHKLSKSQKSGFEKIAIEVVDMQTAKIQLNSGLAKYILYGLA